VAILSTARNPAADMHAVDPRIPGPHDGPSLPDLLERSRPWSEANLQRGLAEGARVKLDFSKTFSQ
jgi:iron(III) transport system substrate-binding protein